MTRASIRWSLVLSALTLTGCDPDTAVFVEATLADGTVALQSNSLGVGIGGSFEANLRLGERASGPSDVQLRSISLANADRSQSYVDNLQAVADTTFPVTVGIDETVVVRFTLSPDDNFGEASLEDELCSGPLTLVGVFEGSLRGGPVDAATDPVTPSGCP